MIKDAGFVIKSEIDLDMLISQEERGQETFAVDDAQVLIKNLNELRPQLKQDAPSFS